MPTRTQAASARTPHANESDLVRRLDSLVKRAIRNGASDIHFEPRSDALAVRTRIDGVLRDIELMPAAAAPVVASRIKVIARLDIAERRLPQDGRFSFVGDGTDAAEIRVSSLPTVLGEKIVLRVLRKEARHRGLDALGMLALHEQALRRALQSSAGMTIVAGPTGSGKSTTLYAAVEELNDGKRNILTVEDPVERRVDGVNQVQVNDEIGLTFARALRAFLRQDPDVILVGEIRDRETAEIGVRAALTGHVVLSTLHASDAAASIARLVDMGVAPFLVAASLRAVVAQRLVRLACRDCRGEGCNVCGGTGMRGRTGVFEVMPVSEPLRRMIVRGASADALRKYARSQRHESLADAARACAQSGIAPLSEAARIAAELE